jgi:MFS family permease
MSESMQSTKSAFLWTRVLNIPFWVLLNLLPMILYKDLHITPWMITMMVVLKPASALFASYWGALVHERRDRLVLNLVSANLLRYIPFLFLPWITSPWVIIGAFAFYMMLSRGVIPAWMEIFKENLQGETRSRVFVFGSALDYLASAILPLALGWILDETTFAWHWLFPATALLGLFSTLFLFRLHSPKFTAEKKEEEFSLKKEVLKPWKESLRLLKERPDFAKFQIGFMLGGAALMVVQPVIPIFFVDVLNLSYTKMLLALAVFKSIGYAIASPLWVKLFEKFSIFEFSGRVILLGALFPALLVLSSFEPSLVYLAYLLYGIFQAGSELCWHLSGPTFSHDKESSAYSTTNVLSVGVRGCVAPPLGSVLFALSNSATVLALGVLLSLFSAFQFIYKAPVTKKKPTS